MGKTADGTSTKSDRWRIEVNEEQMHIIKNALEEYMRLRLGQWRDLADDLAFEEFREKQGRLGKGDRERMFDRCIHNRDAIQEIFEATNRILYPNFAPREQKRSGLIAGDIWSAMRYAMRESRNPPLNLIKLPMPVIEEVEE